MQQQSVCLNLMALLWKLGGGGATLTPPLTPGFDTYVSAAFLELIWSKSIAFKSDFILISFPMQDLWLAKDQT